MKKYASAASLPTSKPDVCSWGEPAGTGVGPMSAVAGTKRGLSLSAKHVRFFPPAAASSAGVGSFGSCATSSSAPS